MIKSDIRQERKLKPYNPNLSRSSVQQGKKRGNNGKKYYSLFRDIYGYGYSSKELAEQMGVSEYKIRQWHRDGSLSARASGQKTNV